MAAPGGQHRGGLRRQGGDRTRNVGNAADDAEAPCAQGDGKVEALAGAAQKEDRAAPGIEALAGEARERSRVAAGAGDVGVAEGARLGGGGITDGENGEGWQAGGEAVGTRHQNGLGGRWRGGGAAGDGEEGGDDGHEAAFGETARGFTGAGFGAGDEDADITRSGHDWRTPLGGIAKKPHSYGKTKI